MTDPNYRPAAENLKFELVSAMTSDLVKLHGLFAAAQPRDETPQSKKPLPIDAAILLHGLAGNFYNSSLNVRLAESLLQNGVSVVLANTRGHDGISMSPVGGRAATIGAAYEIVDDCKHDVNGWADWLCNRRKHERVAVVGHSLGAIKALYAQAHLPHEAVKCVVGLSATRLCHANLLNSPRGEDFQKWIDTAKQWVEQGRGRDLMNVDFPFPTWMCAEAYWDKYGPKDRYDWMRIADQISVPTLLMFGERELKDNAAFDGLWQQAEQAVGALANYSLLEIASANHFYAGVHHRASEAMIDWLRGTQQVSEDHGNPTRKRGPWKPDA